MKITIIYLAITFNMILNEVVHMVIRDPYGGSFGAIYCGSYGSCQVCKGGWLCEIEEGIRENRGIIRVTEAVDV